MSGLIIPAGPQDGVIWQNGSINMLNARGAPIDGTFTRTTKAWLAWTEYAIGAPRTVTYAGGQAVLIEGPRTNIYIGTNLQASSAILTASLTLNDADAPDGTRTAARVKFPSSTAMARVQRMTSPARASPLAYTISAYVRAVSGSPRFRLGLTEAGVATNASPDRTATATWTRHSFTSTLSGNGDLYGQFISSAADEIGEFEVWGMQVESGVAPSTLIPTTTTSVTRQGDYWRVPLHTLFERRTAFTVAAGVWSPSILPGGATIWELRNNAGTERFGLWRNTGGANNIRLVRSGAGGTLNTAGGPSMLNVWITTHLIFDGTTLTCYANGAQIWAVEWGSAGFPYDAMHLGGVGAGDYAPGWITFGAPALAIPFIRPWALTAAEIAAEDARWSAALNAVVLPTL